MAVDLSFSDQGQGAVVVLLHGLGLDRRQWDPAVWLLAGHRIIRPDLRGHGRSPAPPVGYQAAHYAQDVLALLDKLSLPPVHLAGHGLGAAAAVELALAAPARVRSLLVVAPVVDGFDGWSEGWLSTMRKLGKLAHEEGLGPALERAWIPDPIFDGLRARPDALEQVREMWRGFSGAPLRLGAAGERPAGPPALERLAEIAVPTLAVCGADDRGDFHAQARLIEERVPGATREVLEGGHFVEQENPGGFARLAAELWGT